MITKDVVKKVADLSRITFSEEELDNFTKEFANIVSFVEMIGELDTSSVAPSPYPIDMVNDPREDMVKNFERLEDMLRNAPKTKEHFIVVPKVIDK
ncbi:MAG: Asp-tRNA(Asn)/Glu-tRNA(Gln) amidotransferase subunit GatC [Brevinematia bacterium]